MNLPKHLPEKLTIAFPIWLLYGVEEGHVYQDIDKVMREHKERGFNCLRFDDGAGLIHDVDGNELPPFMLRKSFGAYSNITRQSVSRDGMRHDLLKRLIEICESAKRHGMYVILSSWFYLHTFWYVGDNYMVEKMHNIPKYEIFMTFAKYLDYILQELKKRDLFDCIAFCEIANEADGWAWMFREDKAGTVTYEEALEFKKSHEKALAWIQEKYPEMLFAYDCMSPSSRDEYVPENMQVYNSHPYFMWNLYSEMQKEIGQEIMVENPVSVEEIRNTRKGARDVNEDWYDRVWFYANLDEKKMPYAEKWLEERFHKNREEYVQKLEEGIVKLKEVANKYGTNVPIVCGEGVTYVGSYLLQWEEKSDAFWEMIEHMARRYRDEGVWGTVIKTCCGPEDPSWDMCKDRILKINKIFLGEDE